MGRIKNFWPIVFIGIIVLIISVRNYIPGTWLIGWDNLNPEFNFPLNIHRSIFSVWQEYQGLGSVGGLAYASDLIRQIGLWILHSIVPSSLLRYISTFTMLFLGPLGIYVLLKKIIFKDIEESLSKIVSFLGAVFYLLNLATVQTFFTPFESFTAFYGFFPWLIFSFISCVRSHDKKHLIVFSIINILAMTSFYVSTIFIIFIASLTLLILGYFIENKQISILKKSSKLLVFTFFINAFWLLPFLYFTLTHINQPVESHMNWVSTEDIYLRNKQFGGLSNVMLVKGFAFNYVDKDASGNYSYLMKNWREHVDKPYVKFIGFTLFLIIIFGFLSAHKEKKPYRWSFTLLFIFSFLMLANDTLPFSFIVEFFRTKSSLFAQIFRVAFTKFGNVVLFSYTIFFVYGILAVISYFNRLINNRDKLDKFVTSIVIFCLGIYILPVFKGELFYYKTRIKIPDDYFSLMDYVNKQISGSRIALLPQFTYWGWNYYKWGYGGSGFLWYGIRNPTLDRAFDGYRKENENYYWEISNALYSNNLPLFEELLEKYQVEWVLFDENIIGSVSTRALNFNRIQEIVGKSTKLNLVTHFGKLKVYHISLTSTPKDFVFLAKDLPVVGPTYRWNNFDKAYLDYGNYISIPSTSEVSYLYDKAYEEYGNYITDAESGKREAESEDENSLLGSFGARNCKECNDYSKKKDDYYPQEKGDIKSIIHNVSNLAALLVNNILNNHAASIPTTPNSTIDQSSLSTPEIIGDRTTIPKITWPALSNILAKRNNSSPENTGSRGNGGLIKTIYADDSTDDDNLTIKQFNNVIYYPFRSLFTGRQQNELEFGVEDRNDYFSLTAKIPKELAGYRLIIPELEEKEAAEIDQNDLSKNTVKSPEIYLDGEVIQIPPPQGSPSATPGVSLSPSVSPEVLLSYIKEGNLEVRVPKIEGYYSAEFIPTLLNLEPKSCDQFNKGIYKHEFVSIPTIGEDLLRLTSIGSSNCLDFSLPNLSQDIGFLVTVETRNIEGKSLLFSVINKNSQRADIETYLPKNSPGKSNFVTPSRWPNGLLEGDLVTSYFIIPPMEQYGLGYTLHVDNISIGRVKTVNDLGKITVNPIPYRFLTSLKIIKGDPLRTQGVPLQNLQVDHPNPSFYQLTINKEQITDNNATMILSQSFDDGWKAYNVGITNNESRIKEFLINLFPFWFGKEIKNHILVNNWENGWQIGDLSLADSRLQDNSTTNDQRPTTIIIVYLPQYLEYIGFILLGVAFLIVIFYPNSHILNPRDGKS